MLRSLILFACVIVVFASAPGQVLLVENFDDPVYALESALDTTYWKLHSGSIPDTVKAGLTYSGYAGSGVGNSVQMSTAGDADYHLEFTAQTSGSVYSFFLVNVSWASTSGDYFFHYSSNPFNGGSTGIRGRVYTKANATGDTIAFGLAFRTEGSIWTDFKYLPNTTYLLAFKVDVVAGDSNDVVSLYVFSDPAIPTTEPTTPDLGPVGDPTSNDNIGGPGSIALRQGGSNDPIIRIDGIRVSTSWADIATSVEDRSSGELPASFVLSQNYPNPFNPSTTIRYDLLTEGEVVLKVFSVLGTELATLVEGTQSAGYHQVSFDGTNLPSGVYLYKLTAGGTTTMKRMVLLK